MSISPAAGPSAPSPAVTATEIGVAVLKKAQEARKAEGEAMVELIRESASPGVGRLIDVRA